MKQKFLYGFAVLAIAVVAAWNVNLSSKGSGLSDLALANVEALAGGEGDEKFADVTCTEIDSWDQEKHILIKMIVVTCDGEGEKECQC